MSFIMLRLSASTCSVVARASSASKMAFSSSPFVSSSCAFRVTHRFFRAVLQFRNRCTKPPDFELRLFQFGARLGKLRLERLDLVEVLRVDSFFS